MFDAHITAWKNHLALIFCRAADDLISHEELEYDFEIDEFIWPQPDWDNDEQQHYFRCLHRYHDRDFPF